MVKDMGRPPINLPVLDMEGYMGARETISSYYVEAEQPNIVFAPYQAGNLYFPAAAVWIDRESGLTSSFSLDSGVVYSVVSHYDPADPVRLRKRPQKYQTIDVGKYLQLPVMPERDKALALKITAGMTKPYEKLEAIQAEIRKRCRYDLGAPFQTEERDAVDFFLFSSKAGTCDQFASAFVVMARMNGIPSRLVTGYTTGEFNPFTGYYEVLAENAHSWAEVYFPNFGWVAFDPTPGSELPAGSLLQRSFVGSSLAEYLSKNFPAQLKALKQMLGTMRNMFTSAYGRMIAAFLLASIFFYMGWSAWRRFRAGQTAFIKTVTKTSASEVERTYLAMCELFAGFNRPRLPSNTPAEYAAILTDEFGCPEISVLTGLFEDSFYGGRKSRPNDESDAGKALRDLYDRLKKPTDKC